jgi:hypothetical protein
MFTAELSRKDRAFPHTLCPTHARVAHWRQQAYTNAIQRARFALRFTLGGVHSMGLGVCNVHMYIYCGVE